jgi:hypothetical protein
MPIPISSFKPRRPIGVLMPVIMSDNRIETMGQQDEPKFKSTVLKKKRDSTEEASNTVFVR